MGDDAGSFIRQVTPIVICFNEGENILRCLSALSEFARVVLVDSGSTDETLVFARRFENVTVVSNPFESFSSQWNFATSLPCINTDWVLCLDSDYILTVEFLSEVALLRPSSSVCGYEVGFTYCVHGVRLGGSLYPPVSALLRRGHFFHVQDGHCMRAVVRGPVERICARILHDDRKPLSRWVSSQARYAREERIALQERTVSGLTVQDFLRKWVVFSFWLAPLYALIFRGAILSGRAGLLYAFQRLVAESLLALEILDSHLRKKI